jgi:hypothetical protein
LEFFSLFYFAFSFFLRRPLYRFRAGDITPEIFYRQLTFQTIKMIQFGSVNQISTIAHKLSKACLSVFTSLEIELLFFINRQYVRKNFWMIPTIKISGGFKQPASFIVFDAFYEFSREFFVVGSKVEINNQASLY